MQKRAFYFPLIAVAVGLAILACKIPGRIVVPQNSLEPSSTPVAETIGTAQPTHTNTHQVTSTPTITEVPASPIPASTNSPLVATPQPTPTPETRPPCNQASLLEDVSIPDGAVLTTGQVFIKTWRLKNTGSCTWNSSYQLVFVSGDQMNASNVQPLTSSAVYPGSSVDVSVNLIAPANAGIYRGYWKIREPAGIKFGVNTRALWVDIKTERAAAQPAATPAETKIPDLFVSEFTIFPKTPVKGQPAHVRVGIYNQGNESASQFTVLWYGLTTFGKPSCSWDILDKLSPNGGRILECDFVFQSTTPINKTSLVIVDEGNHVFESNEGNNEGIIAPFGVVRP